MYVIYCCLEEGYVVGTDVGQFQNSISGHQTLLKRLNLMVTTTNDCDNRTRSYSLPWYYIAVQTVKSSIPLCPAGSNLPGRSYSLSYFPFPFPFFFFYMQLNPYLSK